MHVTTDFDSPGVTSGRAAVGPDKIVILVASCIVLAAAWACFRPLFLPVSQYLFVEDDFFYYLKVAQNLAHGAGSSFNGIVSTNGYHPLWLLMLTFVSFFSSSFQVIFGFVAVVSFLSTVATFLLSRRILVGSGIDALLSTALAGCVTAYSLPILLRGMEVTLTLPLMLLFIALAQDERRWQSNWKSAAILGLLASAMVLSRLDTILFLVILMAGVLVTPARRAMLTPEVLTGFILGLLPIAAYAISNLFLFHTLTPVSGMAKQLKTNNHITAPALRSAFDRPLTEQLILLILLAGILISPLALRRFNSLQRVVFLSTLIFPVAYVITLSIRSDWHLWEWYLYAFRPALCISFVLLPAWKPIRIILGHRVVLTALIAFVLFQAALFRWPYEGRASLLDAAVDTEHFAETHPGIFAMGDRSGITGYLLPDPVVQTEGLVMDRSFLRRIETREPLLAALAAYKVHYYVANTTQPITGCFHAVEPSQAGPASPHMEADLCSQPVASFVHSGHYTYIYDLQANLAPGLSSQAPKLPRP